MLEAGLYHPRGLVRKGSALLLQPPKRWRRARAVPDAYLHSPPVLANSFPKSGTHLLDQIVAGLPQRVNYGGFLSSLTTSFRLRPRSDQSVIRYIRTTAPGENVRGHVFYNPAYIAEFERLNFVHYFIYRDPRDVIVSSCHYLRDINPWHRLRRYFRACRSMEEAILLSIRGLTHIDPSIPLPNIAARFALYEGWIDCPQVCAVRFEDLRGAGLSAGLDRMLDFYAARSATPLDRAAIIPQIHAAMVPEKSHTFRKGSGGGWRDAFTAECKDAFKQVTGDLLVRLGYERGNDW